MDHVFLRDHPPPKICRPLPSAVRFYRGTVSLATGGPQVGEGFFGNCPGTLGDVNPLRNKGLRFPPRRKLASKRVQNTTLGAIAQKNTSIYQWVGVPGQLPLNFLSRFLSDQTLSSAPSNRAARR